MSKKVAIVSVAQNAGAESKDNFYDQAYRVTRECLDKVGLTREDLGTVVSASSDIFHGGISCANAYYWETTGAFLKNASRQDGESLFAFMYGVMRIISGQYDTCLVMSLCKGSENPENDACTLMFGDPFYHRNLGLTETMAAAFQMRAYMEKYGITEEQCAQVAVKNLSNALRNPYAHRRGRYTVKDVLASPLAADPLTELQVAPKSEGFVAMLLASEKKARKLTDRPVWFKGYGSSLDMYFLGDRDLLKTELRNAAARAYKMAGIKDPKKEIDVAEVTEPYAFQELLWCEELGFCKSGGGGKMIEKGTTKIGGALPVNPSGGVLANNPYVSRGLQRLVEGYLQIRGEAGEHQVDKKVKTALAHGTHGYAGQCHAVAIIGV
jgi:acetyl-CoA C-acetyltransferase